MLFIELQPDTRWFISASSKLYRVELRQFAVEVK